MPNTANRGHRRRIRAIVLLFVALIVVGSPIAWRYRPLTATERGMVGTWRDLTPPSSTLFDEWTFKGDRRFSARSIVRGTSIAGTWKASQGEVTLFTPVNLPLTWNTIEPYLKLFLQNGLEEYAGGSAVKFEGTSRVKHSSSDSSSDGWTMTWDRVR